MTAAPPLPSCGMMNSRQPNPADAGRAAILDLASRLESYGEPPGICNDSAVVMRALVAEADRLRATFRINMLRLAPGTSHAEVDAMIAGKNPVA